MEMLRKENDDMKGCILNQERYKTRWCLRIKGKKEKSTRMSERRLWSSCAKSHLTFSKKLNEERKADETKLIKELLSCYSKLNWSAEDKERINNLQSQLDEIYLNKAQGAYIRSRAKWIEDGEKNTSYFSNLEKRRQEKKCDL